MSQVHYLRQVRDLIDSLRHILSESEISEVAHQIDHGEPAVGLRTLAWIIHEEQRLVDDQTVTAILLLIGDLVPKTDLPPNFANDG